MQFSLLVSLVLLAVGSLPALAQKAPSEPPLEYRIVSFHQGKANKQIIRMAHELGFNGVMFQLEGSVVQSLTQWAERNRTEDYTGLCRQLGMKVTLWVHELSDIPEHLGPVTLENEKLWVHLEDRYEWLFTELAPEIDGIVLTVVETQVTATETEKMLRIVSILDEKCRKYDKELIVRTFTWHPDELRDVLSAIQRFPEDIPIMSKCVPQDWQMRGIRNKAIGAVGSRKQIVEFDVAGEYFLLDNVANAMPNLLKEQFDYGLSRGIDGICVRVDRWEAEAFHNPQEMNLWTLGLLASGQIHSVDQAWQSWTKRRYGAAAPAVQAALAPTQQVMEEILNVGSFTFGDNRYFPPNGDHDAFHTNWTNWRWDASYLKEYQLARTGDPGYTRKVERQKEQAAKLAEQSLQYLDQGLPLYQDPAHYHILKTKLTTNQVQLQYRAPMMLAYLKYQRLLQQPSDPERGRLIQEIGQHLEAIRAVGLREYPAPESMEYKGKKWQVGPPEGLDQWRILDWARKMENLTWEAARWVPWRQPPK